MMAGNGFTCKRPSGYVCLKDSGQENAKTKVLLVYPKVGAEAKASLYLPSTVLYLAAYLEDYAVAIFDERVDDVILFEKLLDENPLCVGFSIMTGIQITYALQLAERAKSRGIPVVFGGVHATILPEQTAEDHRVDYVVSGEGEVGLRSIIEALQKGAPIGPVVPGAPVDLNSIPRLPYELLDIEQYVHSAALEGRSLPFFFSRGCPFRCTFCCNPVISKRKWRAMDIKRATDHLDYVVKKYDLQGISFLDENFTVNPAVLNTFAKHIQGRFKWFAQTRANALLKYDLNFLERMGAARFSCGLESGSDRILNMIKKDETVDEYVEVNRRLAETGINVWYNYIIGFPGETLEDVQATVRLAVQMLEENPRANNSTFYLLTPYPGTEIGDNHFKDVMPTTLEGWASFGRHNFVASWHDPEQVKLYSRICFSSKFVGRRLITLFPEDKVLRNLALRMHAKWKDFDFGDDEEWDAFTKEGWIVLKRLFGEHAY